MPFLLRNPILFVCILSHFQKCDAQNVVITPSNLKDGIYLENIKTLIPWKVTLEDVKKYGNPTVEKITNNYTEIHWGDVKLFGGLEIQLNGYFWNPPGKNKLKHFYSYIDSSYITKVRSHVESYF